MRSDIAFLNDLEADLGRAIREVVGPDLPVAGVLDLHGTPRRPWRTTL